MKYALKILSILLICVGSFSCSNNELEEPTGNELEPIQIAQGNLHGNGTESLYKQNIVITNKSQWDDLKNAVDKANKTTNTFLETEIDFTTYQIIAVFEEIKGNGGWSIDIFKITETSNSIIVFVKNIKKGDDTCVMAQPFHIIKISVSTKNIKFVRE